MPRGHPQRGPPPCPFSPSPTPACGLTPIAQTHTVSSAHALSLFPSPSLRGSPIVHEGTWGGGGGAPGCCRQDLYLALLLILSMLLHPRPGRLQHTRRMPRSRSPDRMGDRIGVVDAYGGERGKWKNLSTDRDPLPWHSLRAVRWSPTLAAKPRLLIG